jgi:hypothetical protein
VGTGQDRTGERRSVEQEGEDLSDWCNVMWCGVVCGASGMKSPSSESNHSLTVVW